MEPHRQKLIFPIAVAITVLDQVSKMIVCAKFGTFDAITVIPGFFDIRKVFNEGAAWGLFAGQRSFLVAISIVMLFVLWFHRKEFSGKSLLCNIGIGLLAGGITGNLIDRVKLGYVVDFLDFHWKNSYTFPTFNVADSAICIGVFLYFLYSVMNPEQKKPE